MPKQMVELWGVLLMDRISANSMVSLRHPSISCLLTGLTSLSSLIDHPDSAGVVERGLSSLCKQGPNRGLFFFLTERFRIMSLCNALLVQEGRADGGMRAILDRILFSP